MRDYKPAAAIGCLGQKSFRQSFGRTWNDVAAAKVADLRRGGRAGFDSSSHAADVSADNSGYQSAADVDSFDDLHVGGFGHRVGGFDQSQQTVRFDQSNCIVHVLFNFKKGCLSCCQRPLLRANGLLLTVAASPTISWRLAVSEPWRDRHEDEG